MSDSKAIYQAGAWLIGMGIVGLLAGGINVTTAAYIAQAVSSDLREKTFERSRLSLMPILSSSMLEIWLFG